MKNLISVQILTKNSEKTLAATLQSVSSFPEVIVLDTGSTDETLKICEQFSNVSLQQSQFNGFGPLRNYASSLSSYDWILSVDSDEIASEGLYREISNLPLEREAVYSFQRNNYFNHKKIRCCAGWYPDTVVRLYHRGTTSFSNDAIHEKVISEGMKIIPLRSTLQHTPYHSISDFLNKMERYSSLFAFQYHNKKKSSLFKALFHGSTAFFKNYFFKKGVLGGKEGLIISLYNAGVTYYKYLKLAELNDIPK